MYAGEALAERRRSGRGFACKPQVSLLQGTILKKTPTGLFLVWWNVLLLSEDGDSGHS